MDVQTIDEQYAQLQSASQQVYQELKDLATKLQTEAGNGNQQAREWVLDLREIALAIQAQQQQTSNLLQAIHGFVANESQAYAAQPNYQPPGYQQPGYSSGGFLQPGSPMAPRQGGLGGFLQSGFGRAMEMGLGFGLGDDLMKKLF